MPVKFDTVDLSDIDMPEHCEYFNDADGRTYAGCTPCPNAVDASVEPRPVGDFAPAMLCAEHVFDHIADHTFHLGDDWSITPISDEARERIEAEDEQEWSPNGDIDPELQDSCEHCGHDRLDHAFYPAADRLYGPAAPFCRMCPRFDCEGFVLYPKA